MRDGPTYRLIEALLKEGHPLMLIAARQIASMRAERAELGHRIHCQRKALRENWEIVESRANSMGTPRSRASVVRHIRMLREARAEIAGLKNFAASIEPQVPAVHGNETCMPMTVKPPLPTR